MTRLKARIVDLIDALGPIPVSEYMALCLSDPHDGYYTTRDPFGRAGDFITAPEISQMFGELIGAWTSVAWQAIGSPRDVSIAEIGPGRGTLMKDMVRTLGRLAPELKAATRFRMIETSSRLSWAQATTLEGAGATFDWHKDIDELPDAPLILVGNELFDAIPIRQYVKKGQGWRERLVDIDKDEELRFVAGLGAPDPALLPEGAESAPEDAIVELSPARTALMQRIAERIARWGGAGLFIDYGHLAPAVGDTLQAMRKHSYDDVFAHPGEADITSHVDFGRLADVARAVGLQARLTTQGDFLVGLGLIERAGSLGASGNEAVRKRLRSEVERLAAPDAMGELFKVLAVFPQGLRLPPFHSDD